LIQTAKLDEVEPFAYLCDVFERIVTGQSMANDLAALRTWAWKSFTAPGSHQLLKQ
jgi:hypothetical protein